MPDNNLTEQTAQLLGVKFLSALDSSEIKALPGYQAVAIFHHNRI